MNYYIRDKQTNDSTQHEEVEQAPKVNVMIMHHGNCDGMFKDHEYDENDLNNVESAKFTSVVSFVNLLANNYNQRVKNNYQYSNHLKCPVATDFLSQVNMGVFHRLIEVLDFLFWLFGN